MKKWRVVVLLALAILSIGFLGLTIQGGTHGYSESQQWGLVIMNFFNSASIGFAMLLVPCRRRDESEGRRHLRIGLWLVLDAYWVAAILLLPRVSMAVWQNYSWQSYLDAVAGASVLASIGPLGALGLRWLFCGAHAD